MTATMTPLPAREPRPLPTHTDVRDGLHISHSQLSTFLACPLRFAFKYCRGLQPEFLSSALPFGSSLHESLAFLYRFVQATDQPPPLGALQEVFSQQWLERTTRTPGDVPIKFKPNEGFDTLHALGLRMLEAYYAWLAQRGFPSAEQVAAVELPLRSPLGELDLVGVIDLILRDSRDPSLFHVIDHKSAARRYDEVFVATDTQLTAYRLLIQATGYLPDDASLTLNWDVMLKVKNPTVERYTTVRSDDDVRQFLQVIDRVLRAIDAEAFFPNPSWLCNDCGYEQACREW